MNQLRQGTIQDMENISRILIHVWQKSYADFIPSSLLEGLDLNHQIKRHQAYIKNETQYIVLENQEKELLGFASYGKNRMKKFDVGLELYTIYVHPKQQGMGFGSKLLKTVFENIQGDHHSIIVSVFEDNPFKHFYLKHEFKKVGKETIEIGDVNLISGVYQKVF